MSQQPLVEVPYRIRSDLGRQAYADFSCPLGVHPCQQNVTLREGYDSRFVVGDEILDDQYEFRLLFSNHRVFDAVRSLMIRLLPSEAFGIYEEWSYDAYRDSDVFRSVDVVAKDRILQAWDIYGHYLVETGKCGFGATAQEPNVEIFIEEHGTVYLACSLENRDEIETLIAGFGLELIRDIPAIDNFEHRHREVLDMAETNLMDDYDIKFSIIESLAMAPVNPDEGHPPGELCPYWIQLELDLAFETSTTANVAFISFGITTNDFTEALGLADMRCREKFPNALVARIHQIYRIFEEDVTDEIAPCGQGTASDVWILVRKCPRILDLKLAPQDTGTNSGV